MYFAINPSDFSGLYLFLKLKLMSCTILGSSCTHVGSCAHASHFSVKTFHRVEPRFKDTRLIRTPVNTDNGHFSVSRVTNSYTLSTPLYGHYLSVHCEFSLSRLFANLKTLDHGQIMT